MLKYAPDATEPQALAQRLRALSNPTRLSIFDVLMEGVQCNCEIAERLGLSDKTVKNYVSSMLSKLGMESRTQAAVFATKLAT